jgi:integrase
VRAAVTAQLAAAIAILSFAPVRLGNLASIRLEYNLIKPGGPDSNYWLVFPDYDVKNRVRLEYPLNADLTNLLNEYVHDFRPNLVRGSNERWLFPGQEGGYKNAISFSTQIVKRIHKATGIRITVHQFRHAAAALILKHDPGNYEFVRRLLGHRSIQTTIDFYSGLENIQASERFGDIVLEQLKLGSEPAGNE